MRWNRNTIYGNYKILNVLNYNLNKIYNKIRKNITPQKIKVNRRKALNNCKVNFSSIKNTNNYIYYTKSKIKDEFYIKMKNSIDSEILDIYESNNRVMMKTQNYFNPMKNYMCVLKKRSIKC